MKLQLILSASALAITAFTATPAFAQMNMDHGKMGMVAAPSMTDGEVRKIDKEAGKITIKHGEIKHMDMPGMTMVFTAKDPSVLNNVKTGDKVKFMAVTEGGKFFVTDIQPEK